MWTNNEIYEENVDNDVDNSKKELIFVDKL
jgi:hypothetical protein